MSSKARPKKLKAFVVPAVHQISNQGPHSLPEPGDIGEIHFLVKQEAKGDLRKDARVQDLNNVINRLMSSSTSSAGSARSRRRLRLRTFAVTCLSEDTGILEWVPDTDSLRNLITKTYNPQVSSFSMRRRGDRIGNFSEPSLRNSYERAQNLYFRDGNLSRAGATFGELCSQYPPLFYWWFVQKFHDPHAWYEARNSFALSTAAWSAVGHVIGLGDRHSENILVDTTSGQCVHVDFDW
jgi:serine/threonine-protein kinase ATR